jgi:ferrous-iron efflux pump FieF
VENRFNYLGLHIFSARTDSRPKHAIVVSMLAIRYDCYHYTLKSHRNCLPPCAMSDIKKKNQLTRSATYASVSVALTLMIAKIWAWMATSSVSVLSSLVDSTLDVLASAITFFAVWYALAPADREHRFGHGKAEGLAAFVQSLIIAGSGVFVCYEAVKRFIDPRPPQEISIGVIVMLASVLLTLALLAYQRFVVRQTGSVAIAADAMHYKTDLAVNLGVAVALPVSAYTNLPIIDPLVGIIIAGYILWGTWGIARKSLAILLDHEIGDKHRIKIRAIAEQDPAVKGFHDLRTRSSGSIFFIQFHLELDPKLSLLGTHKILDRVEEKIQAAYPNCEIIIHPDPDGLEEERDSFDSI